MTNAEFSENNLIKQLSSNVERINQPEVSEEKKALLLSEIFVNQSLKIE